MMAAMGMTTDMPWHVADAFLTFAMWAVMMVGMMTPVSRAGELLSRDASTPWPHNAQRALLSPSPPAICSSGPLSARALRWRNGRCIGRRCCH
jgi:hypothetical protein